MTAATRKEAAERGLAHYKNGKECTKGHGDLRYTSSGSCVACTSERDSKRTRRNSAPKMRKAGQKTMDDYIMAVEIEQAAKDVWE